MTRTVAVFVRSLRKGSINRQYARVLEALARDRLSFEFVRIDDLPLYNDDLWSDGVAPDPVMRMKAQVAATAGALIVTPEYNRSIPGALKNALDVGSRPYGHSIWQGKPAAIVSYGGVSAGLRAAEHSQQVMNALQMMVIKPAVSIPMVAQMVKDGTFEPTDIVEKSVKPMLDELHRWGVTLKDMRDKK